MLKFSVYHYFFLNTRMVEQIFKEFEHSRITSLIFPIKRLSTSYELNIL